MKVENLLGAPYSCVYWHRKWRRYGPQVMGHYTTARDWARASRTLCGMKRQHYTQIRSWAVSADEVFHAAMCYTDVLCPAAMDFIYASRDKWRKEAEARADIVARTWTHVDASTEVCPF